jgi:hypothetical protein
MGDSRQKAAEIHNTAEHVHGAAAEHHGQQDHLSGHEQSRLNLEHSTRVHENAEAARRTGHEVAETLNSKVEKESPQHRTTAEAE